MLSRRFALHFSFFVLVVLTVAGPLQARDLWQRQFLPVDSVDAAALVPPPPTVGSPDLKQQMAVVLWLQRSRTPAQVDFVRETLDVDRFAPILGTALLTVDGSELKRTIDAAIDEVRDEYDAIKARYDLPRPFVVNKDVEPVGDARPVASYPSGHAVRAIVYARLLAEVFPDKRDAMLDLARQVGYGRVTAGVHYPMDVLAGQRLGEAFADVIVKQPAFREAVQRIRGTPSPTQH